MKSKDWIPCSEKAAENGSLVCDTMGNVFIANRIVVLKDKDGKITCYDGKTYNGDIKEFLKGRKITTCMGAECYIRPSQIIAWTPLPEPYIIREENNEESSGDV